VATAVIVLVALALIGPRATPQPIIPDPRPTQIPAGVTVLPSFLDLLGLAGDAHLGARSCGPRPGGSRGNSPARHRFVARALAVAEPNRGRLIIIGPDGNNRRFDDPILVNARMLNTSLSPAGDLIALARGGDLLVIEVANGNVRPIAVGANPPESPAVVWRGPHTVLVADRDSAREVDVDTGKVTTLSGVTGADVVAVEGNPSAPFMELVPTGATSAQRSLIRLWRSGPVVVPASVGSPSASASASESASASASASASTRPHHPTWYERLVVGPSWIGPWLGPGWSSSLLFVRACNPATLLLPDDVGVAHSAVGAVMPSGLYAGTLAAVDNAQLEVVGFLRAHQVLVSARANGRTLLLGWTPAGGAVNLVATFTAEVRLSVADMMTVS
jgi:hypothetical protein